MSCFDASTVYYDENSPTMKTYRSYMCPSRDSYILPDRGRDLRVDRFHYPWSNISRKQFFDSKPPQISKLRNILSETISNITKESDLKSGNSVELTLEIELMKVPLAGPTNSLVEVTIIQHKPEENNLITMNSEKGLENKNKLHVDRNSCSSECPSQKRRNWFERVIKRYYYKSPTRNSSEEYYEKNLINRQTQLAPLPDKNIINDHKNNFINVLPEDIITRKMDYSKGYRRVSPTKKTFKDSSLGKKQPSIKKLSNIFLPTKNTNKNKAIKSALSDLKKEVDHMKSVVEKGRSDNKKGIMPVPNLGKLVSNIMADVIQNCNEPGSNDRNSVPINYESFHETAVRDKSKKDTINEINSNKMSGLSRSDICIATSISVPVVKSSCSMNDCSQPISFVRKRITQREGIGDSRQTSSKKKIKYEKEESRHCSNRNEKGDGKRHRRHTVSSKHRLRKPRKNKTLNKKYSVIQWNGRTYEINEGDKLRIEQIIVNELQNLALKEGMECDISPLPSTDNDVNSFKAMEKISSFICELDISDKRLKKVKPQKQKSRNNASYEIEKKRSIKILKRNSKEKDHRVKAELITDASSSPKQTFENCLKPTVTERSASQSVIESRTERKGCKDRPITSENPDVTKDGFEIKYVNTNTNKWSDESVAINSSEIKESNESPTQNHREESKNIDPSGLTFKHLSSGFVKRIESNDSTWNDFPSGAGVTMSNRCCAKSNKVSKQHVKADGKGKTAKVNSATSNESENNIQIELDLKDLETILNEAKHKQDSGKIVINATCKRGVKKNTRSRELTGKNSTSYTDHLLMKAAQKLEKYRRSKL